MGEREVYSPRVDDHNELLLAASTRAIVAHE
jgi:hypothetical protein